MSAVIGEKESEYQKKLDSLTGEIPVIRDNWINNLPDFLELLLLQCPGLDCHQKYYLLNFF